MNYWLHRISHHNEVAYPLLDRNILSIGFSDFSDPSYMDRILSKRNLEDFNKCFDEEWGSRPKFRFSLWRFLLEMKKDDMVIVPKWGAFSIYRIDSDTPNLIHDLDISQIQDWYGNRIEFENGLLVRGTEKKELIDLGFFRKVTPVLLDIPRYEYADAALTARMKIRLTNANITDLEPNIKKAIEAFRIGRPLNIYSRIIDSSIANIVELIRSELNPDKFESLIKWYFSRIGATDTYQPAKNEAGKDGDADIVAVFDPLRLIIYCQVKFHSGQTDSWAIEQIESYRRQKEITIDDGYSRIAWVVSSGDNFSKDSYEWAKDAKVHLIDAKQLAKMLLEVGLFNLDRSI